MHNKLMLFTDGSVNPQSNIGYGAYLLVSEPELSLESLKKRVNIKKFMETSSTKLELQTLLWALNDISAFAKKIIVYTDSQNIMGLTGRRHKLESNDYFSKKKERLKNYELYQHFFSMTDQLDCHFIKVIGHKMSKQKTDIERIFSLVDKASRHALREDNE